MARITVTVTTEDGELLERFAVIDADQPSEPALAKAVQDRVEMHFDTEQL